MRTLALVLAVVAAFGAVAIDRSDGGSTARIDAMRHYYELGRTECRASLKALAPVPVGNVQTWSGFTTVQIHAGRGATPGDRAALQAGCRAAGG